MVDKKWRVGLVEGKYCHELERFEKKQDALNFLLDLVCHEGRRSVWFSIDTSVNQTIVFDLVEESQFVIELIQHH